MWSTGLTKHTIKANIPDSGFKPAILEGWLSAPNQKRGWCRGKILKIGLKTWKLGLNTWKIGQENWFIGLETWFFGHQLDWLEMRVFVGLETNFSNKEPELFYIDLYSYSS